jgi:hypothetical protein
VPIEIEKHSDLYVATVTPPHGDGTLWRSPELSRDALIAELRARGCHTTDIGDAFYEANPEWLTS